MRAWRAVVMSRWTKVPVALGAATCLSFFGAAPTTVSAAPGTPAAPVTVQHASFAGVGSMAGAGTTTDAGGLNDATPTPQGNPASVNRSAASSPGPLPGTPNPVGLNVATRGNFTGFDGLDHADQRLAGTGIYANTQFSLEPPDQALCVGNGFVLEGVNTAFRVFNTGGTALTSPVAYNQFFGLIPEINRTTGVRGDFVSDPKCNFDPATNRWFMTVLEADAPGLCLNGPFNSTVPCGRAHLLIAVSQSPDPTGGWNLFSIDVTNDGGDATPDNSTGTIACPCFGDQPLLGTNADAVIISTNEYGTALSTNTDPGNPENGAQVYAISKSALEAATSGSVPQVAHLNVGAMALVSPDCCAPFDSLQPSFSPTAAGQTHGFEYLMSSFTNHPGVASGINVWALTGTDTLNNPTPSVNIQRVEVPSETYAFDSPATAPGLGTMVATQKDGPRPLASLLQSLGADPGTLELLNANDTRMNQVMFANGKLWGGVNTALVSNNPSVQRAGIAYFVVTPTFQNSTLSATMFKQGYVSVNGESTIFPSIAVNQSGIGAISFTLVGPDYFPSSAYVLIRPTGNLAGDVTIAGAGAAPEDGFTGYPAETGIPSNVARWGDYSAAVTDANGTVWLASEYIPNRPRTLLANWGTFISNVGG